MTKPLGNPRNPPKLPDVEKIMKALRRVPSQPITRMAKVLDGGGFWSPRWPKRRSEQ